MAELTLETLAKRVEVLERKLSQRESAVPTKDWRLAAGISDEAAARFQDLRAAHVKIGTMDLKTACVAMVHHAILLTANRKDFEKVPGLHFENWLD